MQFREVWPIFTLLGASCMRRPSPQVAPSGELDLTRLSDGLYLRVKVGNGRTGFFLIDTGSYCCFATVKGEKMLRAAGATVDQDGTLETGPVSLEGYPAEPIEFSPWGANQDTMDSKADGILGLDFLARYRIGLELRKGTLRLWPLNGDLVHGPLDWLYTMGGSKPGGPPPEAISSLTMKLERGLFTVPVRFDGKMIQSVPDSGSGDTFVSAANARKMGWTHWTGGHDTSLYNGAAHVRHYEIQRFSMGEIEYEGTHEISVLVDRRDVNFVGRDALGGMAMVFDFKDRTLFLVPNRLVPLRR